MNPKFILTLSGPDRLGIVARVSSFLAERNGFILEQGQFGDLATGRFFMRSVFELRPAWDRTLFCQEFQPIVNEFQLKWSLFGFEEKPKALILVSKEAHCLNDLLYRTRHNALPIEIGAIASNHPDLKKMADWYGIPFHHLPVTQETKPAQEERIAELASESDLVILARYMQILSPGLTRRLFGKAINIHHSFVSPELQRGQTLSPSFREGRQIDRRYGPFRQR